MERLWRGSIKTTTIHTRTIKRMKNKCTKGEFLYFQKKKNMEIIKTLLLFGISAALYIAGIIATGSNKNYLTIVAILGCLPASKSAVSMIMYLKAKGCTKEAYEYISGKVGENVGAYNLYFTSYDKNFDMYHVFVKGMTIIAYTENSKIVENAFEEHIKTVLNRDSITGVNVKLYKDLQKYVTRIEQMQNLENEKSREKDIMKTLFAVSL